MTTSVCGCDRFSREHPPDAVGGVTIDWIFEDQDIALSSWRCLDHHSGWSEEKAQLYHVISFVHHGAFAVRDAGGERIVDPSTPVVFYPGAPYTTSHPFGCGDHGSALAVRSDLLREIAPEVDACRATWTASVGPQAFLAHRLQVRRSLRGERRNEMAVQENALRMVEEIAAQVRGPRARNRHSPIEQRRRRERAEAVKMLLLKGLEEPLRLDDLADRVGISVFHLCRSFREETGWPIHRYLQRLRLRAAFAVATEDHSDLGEIALRFGFSSHSHFTAAFHKEFGLPPSAIRQLGPGPSAHLER
jgi:AraC family transcriptional regulator